MNLFERVVEGNFRLIMAPFKIAEKLLSNEVPKRKKSNFDVNGDYKPGTFEYKYQQSIEFAKAMRP